MAALQAPFPTGPFVDAAGNVTPVWQAFLRALLMRTGGTVGVSSGDTAQALSAETAARTASVQSLSTAIAGEAAAREAAISAETAAREAADTALGRRISTGGATTGATAGPALLAHIWFGQ